MHWDKPSASSLVESQGANNQPIDDNMSRRDEDVEEQVSTTTEHDDDDHHHRHHHKVGDRVRYNNNEPHLNHRVGVFTPKRDRESVESVTPHRVGVSLDGWMAVVVRSMASSCGKQRLRRQSELLHRARRVDRCVGVSRSLVRWNFSGGCLPSRTKPAAGKTQW